MLTTYRLTDGSKVVGDTQDIELMTTQNGELTEDDWRRVQNALEAGKVIINLDHVVSMRQPNAVEIDHYTKCGTT